MIKLRTRSTIASIGLSLSLFSGIAVARADGLMYPQVIVGTNAFNNVQVLRVSVFDLVIRFDGGLTKLALPDLPEPLRSKYYNKERFDAERQWEDARKKEEALKAPGTIPRVAIADLLSHMHYYRGKKVEVTGYYVYGFEQSAIYQSREAEFRGDWRQKRSLWIDQQSLRDLRKNQTLENPVPYEYDPLIRMVGIFDCNGTDGIPGIGHMNGWRGQLVAGKIFEEIK